jgi:GT2 family glycosyltransferase
MKPLISFCINTSNNELEYIKLLFKSLKDNLSTLEHEIIVFIDSDNQGTLNWILDQKQIFSSLKILKNPLPVCYGYQRNINEMFKFASNDIVSYLQSDMVISKDYDVYISKHIEDNMILSGTRVEPPLHLPGDEKHTVDFGLNPKDFKYKEFLEYCNNNRQEKQTNYFFAPFTMYKRVWNDIGGHDTRFRRSREDSDVLNRLILNGTKIVQTWDALVYHFTCVSSRGQDWYHHQNEEAQKRVITQNHADRVEISRFNRKWGGFSHGKPNEYYYKINSKINIDTNNFNVFKMVSSFFNINYINESSLYAQFVNQNEHIYANQLLNFSKKDWKKYSYMYNTENLEDYISLDKAQGDVLIEFNLSNINQNTFNSIISNLQHIVHHYDIGWYEYEGFEISIKNKNNIIEDKIKITNPPIKKEHKYLVL